MEKLLKNSLIKGFLFSIHDDLGPQNLYAYPSLIQESEERNIDRNNSSSLRLTFRDAMQISIKNLSLLMRDMTCQDDEDLENFKYFAIIPYPDFSLTSLTYFHYISIREDCTPIETAFSILIDENKRHFLYNNHNSLKLILNDFFINFDTLHQDEFKEESEVTQEFEKLIKKIIKLETHPKNPITAQRKMKILFSGLDDSGKSSFLLALDRKFSKLMDLKPTRGASVQSIQALGANLFIWDLGGQSKFREKYISKSNIYLYESDLIFYFIDIRNSNRFNESLEYLRTIIDILEYKLNQKTSIIFILSKGDLDVINKPNIKDNVMYIESQIKEIVKKKDIDSYITSIFEITTILRAFSAGIATLSPNRDLINYNLKGFSKKTNVFITLLLSEEGLVLANFYSKKAFKLMQSDQSPDEFQDIFEITAPQFAMLFKIFSKFKAIKKSEAVFNFVDSYILIKRLELFSTPIFVLFLMDNLNKRKKIDKELPKFTEKLKDLLITYIS
ncbi:MAG: hypothetical protein GF317_24285 [Candidatus Lokiarchaeota archaeon]|nr:hypothetical protein [Candidatus Lokiarchaeota archaeon]MBD3202493.1 hypothetical protein [Candidatus Lokiarchaeota archaeon]